MPYPGVPSSKTKEMESCVSSLMSDSKMESKYPDVKERKSHCIAICHSSIVGKDSSILDSENMKGGEIEMTDKAKDLEKVVEPKEEVVVEKADAVVKDPEVVVEDKPVSPVKEEPVEEVKPEEKSEVKPEVVEPEVVVPVAKSEDAEKVSDKSGEAAKPKDGSLSEVLAEALKSDDVKQLKAALQKAIAHVKGCAKPASKVEVAVEPVVEKLEVTKEEPKKADESLVKINDSLQKMVDQVNELGKKLETFDSRLNKIEEQPVPSKVVSPVVVAKVDNVVPKNEELEKINKELFDLEDMKKNYMDRYQKERKWERAFELIRKRDQILGQP